MAKENPFLKLGEAMQEARRKLRKELGLEPNTDEAFSDCVKLAASGLATNQDHYNASGHVQPIEAMQANMTSERFLGFLQGNCIKYSMRAGRKGDEANDVDKIVQYATWWKQALEGKTIDPREPAK